MRVALFIAAVFGAFCVAFALIPPSNVIGSYLPLSDERRRFLIRAEEEKFRDMGLV